MNVETLTSIVKSIIPKPKAKRGGKKKKLIGGVGTPNWYKCPFDDFSSASASEARQHYTPENHKPFIDMLHDLISKSKAKQRTKEKLGQRFVKTFDYIGFEKYPTKELMEKTRKRIIDKILSSKPAFLKNKQPAAKEEEKNESHPMGTQTDAPIPAILPTVIPGIPIEVQTDPKLSKKAVKPHRLTKIFFTGVLGAPKLKHKQALKQFFQEMAITQFEQLPPALIKAYYGITQTNKTVGDLADAISGPFSGEWRTELSRIAPQKMVQAQDVKLKARPKPKKVKVVKVKDPIVLKTVSKKTVKKPQDPKKRKPKPTKASKHPIPKALLGKGVELEI